MKHVKLGTSRGLSEDRALFNFQRASSIVRLFLRKRWTRNLSSAGKKVNDRFSGVVPCGESNIGAVRSGCQVPGRNQVGIAQALKRLSLRPTRRTHSDRGGRKLTSRTRSAA